MISPHTPLPIAVVVFDDEDSIMSSSDSTNVDASLLDDDLSTTYYEEYSTILKGGDETENPLGKIPGSLKSLLNRARQRGLSEDDSMWSLDSLHLSTCRRCKHTVSHTLRWDSTWIDLELEDDTEEEEKEDHDDEKREDHNDEDDAYQQKCIIVFAPNESFESVVLSDLSAPPHDLEHDPRGRSTKKTRDLPESCPTQSKRKIVKSSPIEYISSNHMIFPRNNAPRSA